MKYLDLRAKFMAAPILKPGNLSFPLRAGSHEPVQFAHWVKKGLLIRLKKGLYALPGSERIFPLWLANQLYFPSYVSLEYVLSQSRIIPEAVGTVTSVTTRKTQRFSNLHGTFSYQKVAPGYFFGFKTFESGGQSYFMAFLEKALLDFLYLSVPKSLAMDELLFLENYRFQNLEQLNVKRLKDFLRRFQHPRVQKGGAVILDLLKKL